MWQLLGQITMCDYSSAVADCINTEQPRVRTNQIKVHPDFEQKMTALFKQLDVSPGVVLDVDPSPQPKTSWWRW